MAVNMGRKEKKPLACVEKKGREINDGGKVEMNLYPLAQA